MSDSEQDRIVAAWAKGLGREPLDVWRESMANLRQLHGDVWNGVRFFTTVNGILLAGIVGLLRLGGAALLTFVLVLVVGSLGLAITVVARRILRGHRDYYLEMLLRKTLIEDDLGFYRLKLSGVELSFPWRVPAQYLPALKADPGKWMQEQRTRSGTISMLLFRVYEATIALWILVVLIGGTGIIVRVLDP